MKKLKTRITLIVSITCLVALLFAAPVLACGNENIKIKTGGASWVNRVVTDYDKEPMKKNTELAKFDIEEDKKDDSEVIEEEQKEEVPEAIANDAVVKELDETEEGQPKLLDASGDTIYWGIDEDGVLRISVSEVGGEPSGNFLISENPCTWFACRDGITKVYVGDDNGTVSPTDMSMWFYCFSHVEEISFVNIDTSNVTDMEDLFGYCSNLESLNVSGFDTGNVTNMYGMFEGCESLKNIDLSNIKTSKVTDIGYMFDGCASLESIDISGFDTSNVTSMAEMFAGCESLNIIDLSSFDTGKVEDMMFMFDYCSELRKIYVGDRFSTTSLKEDWRYVSVFEQCTNLVGGSGTSYSEDHVDSTYARVDDPLNGKPGYFTQIPNDDPDIPPFHPVRPTDPTSSSSSVTSSATGKWEYHSDGDYWTYTKNGILKNTWAYLDNPYASANQHKSDWFYFDGTGKMLTGWQKINNSWYYLHPFKDGTGTLGACLIGPAVTPDGYEVDVSGAWTGRTR